ncbi:MAG: multidrug transporter ATP-binding protein [Paenibacillaceae bacterium]|nr:multidrug transporter ATP-binding protein [Paenibacillaceae bacterium]
MLYSQTANAYEVRNSQGNGAIGGHNLLYILSRLRWFFHDEWKRYSIALIFLAASGIMEIIPPMLVGRSIDSIQSGALTWGSLTRTLFQIGLVAITAYLINYIWMSRLFGGAFVLELLMRRKLMKHLLKMTPKFYEKHRTGDLMALATNDLQAISQTAGFGILTLLDSTLWMTTILTTMTVFISWKLTLASILPLPIMAVMVSLYGKQIRSKFTAAQDAFGAMNDGVLETVSGIRVIRAYVRERATERKFAEVTQDVLDKNIAVARIDALFEPTIKILVGASYLIGLSYGAYLVYHNELMIGGLVSFNVYLGMLIWPMFAIGELINVMQRGNASLKRMSDTLDYPADVPEPSQPVDVEAVESIEFRNVSFRYPASPADQLQLRDLSLRLKRGQTLGLAGRTGSGKTTLLKQLLREYPPGHEGTVEISGVPIERIALDRLKSWYGYVPQEHFLFSRTLRENILFGLGSGAGADAEARLRQAIADAALDKDLAFLPEGLDTLVGERGVALSGGQKQRVAIARALIADPQVLILDDCLSAVDARTEARILANLRRARVGKTTLIAAHRLSALQHADWILVLDDGAIREQGTHEQLMRQDGWYKEQYILQQAESDLESATAGTAGRSDE